MMVYSTGGLLLPQLTRVPYPDPGFRRMLGCVETSPQIFRALREANVMGYLHVMGYLQLVN